MRWMNVSGVATWLLFELLLPIAAQADAPSRLSQGPWTAYPNKPGCYYCRIYYRPTAECPVFQKCYAICYPQDKGYVYFYDPSKKEFFARNPIPTRQDGQDAPKQDQGSNRREDRNGPRQDQTLNRRQDQTPPRQKEQRQDHSGPRQKEQNLSVPKDKQQYTEKERKADLSEIPEKAFPGTGALPKLPGLDPKDNIFLELPDDPSVRSRATGG